MNTEHSPSLTTYVISSHWDGLPTLSPYCLKLLTWLRATGVPYELAIEENPMKGPKKKTPWIVENGQATGDTRLIVGHIERTRGVSLDDHLDARARGTAHLVARACEDNLHQALEWAIFLNPDGWEAFKDHFHFIPFAVRPLVLPLIRWETRKALHSRGLTRHSLEEMEAIVREDIAALAAQLGEQDFMFGDRICTADCTVYGFLAVFRSSPFEWFAKDAVLSHTNLVDYVERIRARYWAT